MKHIPKFLFCFPFVLSLYAQDGSPVNVSPGPPVRSYQRLLYYSGANLQYVCYAPSTQEPGTVTVTAAFNANPVSFTATAHGFDYQAGATVTPAVKISGATGSWTPINGVWIATPTSANAFTIPVDSSLFGALTGTLVVTTTSPRTNQNQWAINKLFYDIGGNLIASGWASNPGGAGAALPASGSGRLDKACASRASYGYQ